ncbi:MAG: DUF695 domain-containing protein [Peptococcaceae bacterium]|nr:DUF695 domain-containing protein [Peptococcaceae bacterium]
MTEERRESFIEFTTGLEEEALPEFLTMETDWDMYVTVIDDEKALVMVDMAAIRVAPIIKCSNLLGIQIAIQHPTEDGFYQESERDTLFGIEDRIEDVFKAEAHAKHIATITSGGSRMLYFYAEDDTYLAGLVGKIASEYSNYQFNYLLEKDAPWNFYFNVVYPSAVEFQIMKNRKVVQNMARAGADLSEQYEVNHWFFFDNGASRGQAKVRLMALGYEILEDNFYNENVPGTPFGLHILGTHDLQIETLTELTYDFFDLAEEYQGIYDGWEVLPDGDPETDFI